MKRITIRTDQRFNHCATVCCMEDLTLVAHYAGSGECNEDQHVILTSLRDGEQIDQVHLEGKTGNPVLFKHDGRVFLGHSLFEKMVVPRIVDRWAYCSLWIKEVKLRGAFFELGESIKAFKDYRQIGFLFRCSPIYHQGETYVPIYREESKYGAIANWDGERLKLVGKIGQKCRSLIQPTVWFDGSAFHALCRNMHPETYGMHAFHSTSPNLKSWTAPTLEKTISNCNNSLIVINDERPDPLVVWNRGQGRYDLSLGRLSGKALGKRFGKLNVGECGSYPNYCLEDGRLHLVWTDAKRDGLRREYLIKLLTFEADEYDKIRG